MTNNESQLPVTLTLVAGLGGTGSQIATEAARSIKEVCGQHPPFIRYLKLDADDYEGDHSDEAMDDFINLQEHMNLPEVIRDFNKDPSKYAHLDWLRGLRSDAFVTRYGCRGIPRLGRLAFLHVREKVVRQAVEARFQDLVSKRAMLTEPPWDRFALPANSSVVVHVASSICGGTGAGMLIDFAYNVQLWSQEFFGKPAEVIAHLMLPEAFDVPQYLRTKLKAVAGVTLKQIEFLTDSEREDLEMHYREGVVDIPKDSAPFTFIYLLNDNDGRLKHDGLAAMAGRMIRSMTIEPAALRIRSDANNKQQDILSNRDLSNGHQRCFSSYGLHSGRSVFTKQHALVSLCEGVVQMATHQDSALRSYIKEIDDYLLKEFDVSGTAENYTHAVFPQWLFTGGTGNEEAALKDIEKHIREKIIDSVRRSLERQAEQQVSEKTLAKRFETEITDAILRDVETKPLEMVGTRIQACSQRLAEWRGTNRENYRNAASSAEERFVAAVINAMGRGKTDWESTTAEDINNLIESKLDEEWRNLATACTWTYIEREAAIIADKLVTWQRILKRLAKEAERRKELASTSNKNTGDFNQFTHPLGRIGKRAGIGNSGADETNRRPMLIRILNTLVLNGQDQSLQDDQLRKQFEAQLNDVLEKDIGRFQNEAQDEDWRLFKRPADGDGRKHEYARSVKGVHASARPQIMLHHEAEFGQPLDSTIVQHVGDTCVTGILAGGDETSIREARVPESFAMQTGIWVQIMRFRYGFCLAAISDYPEYERRIDKYVAQLGIKDEKALWLDHEWSMKYQVCLTNYENAFKKIAASSYLRDRDLSNRICAFVAAVRRLPQAAKEDAIEFVKDVKIHYAIAELLAESEFKLKNLAADVSAAPPGEDMATAIHECKKSIEKMLKRLEEVSGGILGTKQENAELKKAVEEYDSCSKGIFVTNYEHQAQACHEEPSGRMGGDSDRWTDRATAESEEPKPE